MFQVLPFRLEALPPPPPSSEGDVVDGPEEDLSLPDPWKSPIGATVGELVRRGILRRPHGLAMLETFMEVNGPWAEVPAAEQVLRVGRLQWWSDDLVADKATLIEVVQHAAKNPVENTFYVQEALRRAESVNKGHEAKIIGFTSRCAAPATLRESVTRLSERLAFYDSNLVWNQPQKLCALRAMFVRLLAERTIGRADSCRPPEPPRKGILDSILPWMPDRKSR